MQNKQYYDIGVDIGNIDTKSSKVAFLSGYYEYDKLPFGASENSFIKYNEKYYVQIEERFPYVQDKTSDEKMFILTLFAIAKEIYTHYEEVYKLYENKSGHIKNAIEEIKGVNLGVGLPPMHLATLKAKVENYYKTRFEVPLTFKYRNITYNLSLGKFAVFAQNFSTIVAFKKSEKYKNSIIANYEDYYVLDIGGYTLDKIAIIKGNLDVHKCDSMDLGIIVLCDQLTSKIKNDYGITIPDTYIIDILKGRKMALDETIQDSIKKYAKTWTHSMLDKVKQGGVDYSLYPIVFEGGTSLLLKEYIESYSGLKMHEFIESPNINADAYKTLIKII